MCAEIADTGRYPAPKIKPRDRKSDSRERPAKEMNIPNRQLLHRAIVGQIMEWSSSDWGDRTGVCEWEAEYIASLAIEQYLKENGDIALPT